jgi:hypothetical protein
MKKQFEVKGENGVFRGEVEVEFVVGIVYDLIHPLQGKVQESCKITARVLNSDIDPPIVDVVGIMTEAAIKEAIERVEGLLMKLLEYKASNRDLRELKEEITMKYLFEKGYRFEQWQ